MHIPNGLSPLARFRFPQWYGSISQITDKEALFLFEMVSSPSLPNGAIIEIGTNMGGTARGLAEANNTRDRNESYIGCDPYPAHTSRPALRAACCFDALLDIPNAIMVVGTSHQLVMLLGMCRARLVFVDGDHTAQAVVEDTTNAVNLLIPGGVITVHDTTGEGPAAAGWKMVTESAPAGFVSYGCVDSTAILAQPEQLSPEANEIIKKHING